MKELRLAIVGCFGRGRVADNAHQPEEGVRIVAGADKYPDALELFVRRYQEKFDCTPNTYSDYREMIETEKPDGVFITSPDFLHEEQAVFALEHKVAVYLEKPLAISIEGADRILEAAYRNRTPLMLGHNMRYMSFTRKMKELIDAGAVGEVRSIWCRHFVSYGGDAYFRDWHAMEKYVNSLLLQKGAHDIDVIHWLAGGFTTRVNGMGSLSVYDKLPRRAEDQLRTPRPQTCGLGRRALSADEAEGLLSVDRGQRPQHDKHAARQRRARLLSAMPLHSRRMAQLHRDRDGGQA